MYFKNLKEPTMNELVYWFQIDFPDFTLEMKNSLHSHNGNPNNFHLEDSVWTHTMMVCKVAEINKADKINKICALLHDLGKVEARVKVEKDDGTVRVRFSNHEQIGTYKSIEFLDNLLKQGVIDKDESEEIMFLINHHGDLFTHLKDGKMYKPEKIFVMFNTYEKFDRFIKQVYFDQSGRFHTSQDSGYDKLGTEFYTKEQYEDFWKDKKEKEFSKPYIECLLGVPGSGKSTFLNSKVKDSFVVLSRDDILMEYAHSHEISGNFSEVWKQLSDDEQKEIDKLLHKRFNSYCKNNLNIVVDMTNMSLKSRRKWFNSVPKHYYKVATFFRINEKDLNKRLKLRCKETGKCIRESLIQSMKRNLSLPTNLEVDKFNIEWQ
jgi:predicted kinase